MSLYLQLPENQGKAQQIVDLHDGKIVREADGYVYDPDYVDVCVVKNGLWDAALVIAEQIDYANVIADTTGRPVTWVRVARRELLGALRANGRSDTELGFYGMI